MNHANGTVRLPASWIVAILALGLFSGCSRLEKSWAAAKAMPLVSVHRTVGTPAYPGDPADVKRAMVHPTFPTGGWGQDSIFDKNRTLPLTENTLLSHNGLIAGYVRYDRPGTLQVRCYDDVYGRVYGGWSPHRLHLDPSQEFQFVALGKFFAGDGGLNMVHEAVWFEDGQTRGTIVYSSKHKSAPPQAESAPTRPTLGPADLFRPEELGNTYNYNHRLAMAVIGDLLSRQDLAQAERVLDQSFAVLQSQREMVMAVSQKPIPNWESRNTEWTQLTLIKLGLQIRTPEFAATVEQLRALLAIEPAGRFFRSGDGTRAMLPLYEWFNAEQLTRATLPALEPGTVGLKGFDRAEITAFLKGEIQVARGAKTKSRKFHDWPDTHLFWQAVRLEWEGEHEAARAGYERVLRTNDDHSSYSPFEYAAAAARLRQLAQTSLPTSPVTAP